MITSIIIDARLNYKKLKLTQMYYILNNISNFRVYASYLRRLGIARITIYTPYTYHCKQIGHNRRGCRNRRKELEVVE